MCKMVKFSYRIALFLLLCYGIGCISPIFGANQHSLVDVFQEEVLNDRNKGAIGLWIVGMIIMEYAKRLDNIHDCPLYCEVDHNHLYWENNEETKSNIPPDDGLPRPDKSEPREQSEGDSRPIASTN